MKKLIATGIINVKHYPQRNQTIRNMSVPKALLEKLNAEDKDMLVYEENEHGEVTVRIQKIGE